MKVDPLTLTLSPPRGERGTEGTPRSFAEILRSEVRSGVPPARPPPEVGLRGVLRRVEAAEARVDALLEAAARGRTFTPAQLLALQATVFRYSQAVEVVSRAADRLVGAVKQAMGTQV
jgi:hypothetical protein